MNGFFGRKINTPNKQRALSRLMMTSALVAAGTLVLSSSAQADDSWANLTQTGGSFSTGTPTANITNITVTSANGKAVGTGNADIYANDTVNVLNSNLFVVRDNRADPTKILGKLNSTGKVVVIDANGVFFGKDSVINVGSIIATTGDIKNAAALADADNPLVFTNFGTGEVSNAGTIQASGLVAFVAPTVKNSGVINASLGRVSLAAGQSTATVDLYGDGLVEFSTGPLVSTSETHLSENTGSITGGKIQMTAAAAKSVVDSVVNMEGVLNATSAVKTAKGEIILSAGKVTVGKPTTKTATSVTGNTKITATQLDLGLTINGTVSGEAKVVNISSNGAKIAQGLNVVSAGGTVNVAAGTYNEHLVMDKAGVTLNGANAGIAANGVRGSETIIIPNSPGVTITANNVTVDGLTFAGATGADGYGIFVNGGNNATLKNNIINNNSQNGIYLLNSAGSVISGNAINNTGSHGIYALNSANTQILKNSIGTLGGTYNIKGDGVKVEKSDGTVVKGNTITQTKSTASQVGSGVYILGSNNVTIGGALAADKNTISNSQWDNIKIEQGSNILVEGNDLNNATRVGVYADGTSNVIARNNDIDGSLMYGVKFTGVTGVSSVTGNTIDTVGIDGITMYFSTGVSLINNIIGYGNDGILNTADDTVIKNDGISIVYSGNTQASGNKVAHTKNNGIYIVGASGVSLAGNTVDFTNKNGVYLLSTTGAQITNNKIGTVGTNNNINADGILAEKSNGTVIKGNTITETTSTAADIGSGIHILNSNNVTIGGASASDKNTISNSEWDNVKVTNGNNILVEGNDLDNAARVGVYALGTTNIIARNNDIDGAKLYGVKYTSVSGTSSVIGNTIDTIGVDGIDMYFSNGVSVTNNLIGYGNDGILNSADDTVIGNDGISLIYSNGIQASGNKVAHTKGNGIYVTGATSGITLSGNTINFTKKSGMYLFDTVGTQILNNNIGTIGLNNNINGDGILAEKSNGTVIKGNTITETTSTASKIGSGIHILNSDNVTVGGPTAADKNTISQSEWDNIKVTAGNNVLVEGNDLDSARRVGVYSEYTNNMVARNNDIDGAQMYGVKYMAVTGTSTIVGNAIDTIGIDGINVYFSDNNVVTGNIIGYGTNGILGDADDTVIKGDGISIIYSKGTQASANKVAHAALNGVYILGESGTTLSGNNIDFSGLDGIQVSSNSNSVIQNNLIGYGQDGVLGNDDTTTGRDGIRVEKSSRITLTGNKVVNAAANGVHVLNSSGLIQVNSNIINDSAVNGILATNAGAIDLRIVGNTVQNTGLLSAPAGSAAINLDISSNGQATVSGNTLGDNFEYGLVGYSGTIDLTGAKNTIQNTRVGLGFYPVDPLSLSLVGDTIGTTAFVDQTQYFVDLGTGAMWNPGTPTLIDGTNATYTLNGVTIDPSTAGGVTQAEYDMLQTMLNDYNDVQDRGLFFYNIFSTASAARTIDQKDVLRDFFGIVSPTLGGGNLTITGLPLIGRVATPVTPNGGFNPALVEPAAGDETADAGTIAPTADDVANIQPAAGGDTGCWSDATASLGQGAPVTFNFGTSGTALLQGAANCGNGQPQSL